MNFLKELCSWSQLRWTKRWTKKKGDMSYIGFGSNKMRTERRPLDLWLFGSHLCLDKSRFWRTVWAKAWLIGGSKENEMAHTDSPFKFWCKMKQIKSSPITLLKKKKATIQSLKCHCVYDENSQFWPMLVLEMLQ